MSSVGIRYNNKMIFSLLIYSNKVTSGYPLFATIIHFWPLYGDAGHFESYNRWYLPILRFPSNTSNDYVLCATTSI